MWFSLDLMERRRISLYCDKKLIKRQLKISKYDFSLFEYLSRKFEKIRFL